MKLNDLPVVRGVRSGNRRIRSGWFLLIGTAILFAVVIPASAGFRQHNGNSLTWLFVGIGALVSILAMYLFVTSEGCAGGIDFRRCRESPRRGDPANTQEVRHGGASHRVRPLFHRPAGPHGPT